MLYNNCDNDDDNYNCIEDDNYDKIEYVKINALHCISYFTKILYVLTNPMYCRSNIPYSANYEGFRVLLLVLDRFSPFLQQKNMTIFPYIKFDKETKRFEMICRKKN